MSLAHEIADVLDEATVKLLTLTSSPAALWTVAREIADGIPAYPDRTGLDTFGVQGITDPRAILGRCAGCGERYWIGPTGSVAVQRFCSRNCSGLWQYRHNPVYRERQLARKRARRAAIRAARRAA